MATAGNATPSAENGAKPAEDSLVLQLIGMTAALWASHQRAKVIALFLALAAVVGASAFAQILLNAWNQPFYDALSRKDVSAFVVQLWRLRQTGLRPARPQCRASVAQPEVEAHLAQGIG